MGLPNLPVLQDYIPIPQMTVDSFGERFLASKYARPYRYKNRAARTNNRTGNKKKMRQYIGR